ncbi:MULTISPECIES: cell division protein ZapA [Ancylobacter]|uniref:Cell division protein ZapA n=1 Tax=Ancylobacter defluvii TaxID=1282440 RepID=A0A9W6N9A5_9HYPH|nr:MULTISPECIES: cell division protein ZapA [Ancylobacter]MBS7587505.1 cell division protein ZapA [Ancylobacter defluvii]MDR6952177.1 cell division protein ZapA [Ancylobacter sp. 3268]GLK82196.1 cell division protein ZapA [Ancylobacter defluvii]
MAHVTVTIAGRAYRMACDDGQEEHLSRLGQEVDARIDDLRKAFGEIGDQRLSVMAAITLADELSEMRRRHRALEQELQAERVRLAVATERSELAERTVSDAFTKASERMERLARELGTSPSSDVGMG